MALAGITKAAERMAAVDITLLPAELSIVVPIMNECNNLPILVDRVAAALDGRAWEVVFVDDDSQDGSRDVLQTLAQQDARVRMLRRVGRRGLSSACIEGVLSTSSPYVIIMDGDLQHDETILPRMLDELREGRDLVVASRYMAEGGGIGEWDESRARISRYATRLAAHVNRLGLSDPMSGFFGFRRGLFEAALPRLSGLGFKLLLDLVNSVSGPVALREVPYRFRLREHGESKLDALVAWEFLMLLADKSFGRFVPVRFLAFALVGGSGVFVHMAVLWALVALGGGFATAQAGASLVAMTSNFLLNNTLTYRDRRLKGAKLVWGMLTFYAICSAGMAANVGAAAYLFAQDRPWWLAGLAGVLIGSVWNYGMSSILTWRK